MSHVCSNYSLLQKVGTSISPLKPIGLSRMLVNIYEAVLNYLYRTCETLRVDFDFQPSVSRNLKLINIAQNKTIEALSNGDQNYYHYGENMYLDCHVNILLACLDPFTKQQLCNCLCALAAAHQLSSIRGTETVSNTELYYPHGTMERRQ